MGIIRIYNTLTRKKQNFKPIKKGKVGMYVCGVTVYDECHIGHIRGAYIFDIIRRYFEYKGYKVKYVRNITDVDDKIIQKARREMSSVNKKYHIKDKVKEVAERYIKSYYDDMESLGIRGGDVEPKATEHIEDMIGLIKKLIKRGYAYQRDGDVYFDVRRFKGYGKLSGQSLDEMLSGVRVELEENKKDPLDFALWKSSKEDEPSWDSPWGKGRPGWHIECSVMSMRYLGENFDIHGGGRDLVFPHHENEIAQSQSATGKNFANYWIHNGLLTINSGKMAKSLGNFVSVKDIVKRFHPEALKIFFLFAHYRSPIDFSFGKIEEADKARERFYILFDKLDKFKPEGSRLTAKKTFLRKLNAFRKRFEEAMDDDFNTAEALAVLFDIVTYINKQLTAKKLREQELYYTRETILKLGRVFGLFEHGEAGIRDIGISKKELKELIDKRNQARRDRDFKTADGIRRKLARKGIVLEDYKEGTTWRLKKA